MKVPISLNRKTREARISFVSSPEFGFLEGWRKNLGKIRHPKSVDAMEFAALACKRFTAHRSIENYAEKVEDFKAHITNNPRSEVAALVFMECDWFPESSVIGVAHFRRSWCNNLILDYLAAHPWIAEKPVKYENEVKGVGTTLLYFVSRIASTLECGAMWGEATQNSCELYKDYFELEETQDLFYIEREKFEKFADTMAKKIRTSEGEWTLEI